MNDKHFYYFTITLEPGYYDGYSLNIDFDYLYFDDWEEKADAQREITQIKTVLLKCVNDFECVAVYPGWCTGYEDYKNTLLKLNAAIKEMRKTVKQTPTYNHYYRSKEVNQCL